MAKILVTGALGQIGSELVDELGRQYGKEKVIAADIKISQNSASGEFVDITFPKTIAFLIEKYQIDTIYHMAAILSATGEKKPDLAWQVNIDGLRNVLEVAREFKIKRIFIPSSIAVFGPSAPQNNTPQDTYLDPQTLYGIAKTTGELLGEYYFKNYGLDVRGIRYPGIISNKTLPGGGTTDYAVEIFYEAIKNKHYTCFVREDTTLPMMYMPDAIKGTIQLMQTEPEKLKNHTNFNLAAISFSAGELAQEIKKHIPEFTCTFEPDYRQKYADSWPKSIDDREARKQWQWQHNYDLTAMVEDMLQILSKRI